MPQLLGVGVQPELLESQSLAEVPLPFSLSGANRFF
jgi:hypothetical protein